jgi:hypothetical protein
MLGIRAKGTCGRRSFTAALRRRQQVFFKTNFTAGSKCFFLFFSLLHFAAGSRTGHTPLVDCLLAAGFFFYCCTCPPAVLPNIMY